MSWSWYRRLLWAQCASLNSGLLSVYSVEKKTHILRKTKGYLISEDLGAVEADTAHDGKYSLDKANVEHRLGEFKVTKVAWALCHPSHACLALDFPVNSPQSKVTEPTGLRLPPLHCLCMFYLNHRHLSLQRQKAIDSNHFLFPEISSSHATYEPD